MNNAGDHVTITEISDFIAWVRHLSAAGPDASPAELAAFHAAKADLFDRIENPHSPDTAEQPNPRRDIR